MPRQALYSIPAKSEEEENTRTLQYPFDPATDKELVILARKLKESYEHAMAPGFSDAERKSQIKAAAESMGSKRNNPYSQNNLAFQVTSGEVRKKLAEDILEEVKSLAKQIKSFRDRKEALVPKKMKAADEKGEALGLGEYEEDAMYYDDDDEDEEEDEEEDGDGR